MLIPSKYNLSDVVGKIKIQSISKLKEKVYLAAQGVLERVHCLAIGLFYLNRWCW